MKVFTVTASNAPVERSFNDAGGNTNRRKNRTLTELLNKKLMVYHNGDLVENYLMDIQQKNDFFKQ
jgi:hypothetical protein